MGYSAEPQLKGATGAGSAELVRFTIGQDQHTDVMSLAALVADSGHTPRQGGFIHAWAYSPTVAGYHTIFEATALPALVRNRPYRPGPAEAAQRP
jgi:hypothetical protein